VPPRPSRAKFPSGGPHDLARRGHVRADDDAQAGHSKRGASSDRPPQDTVEASDQIRRRLFLYRFSDRPTCAQRCEGGRQTVLGGQAVPSTWRRVWYVTRDAARSAGRAAWLSDLYFAKSGWRGASPATLRAGLLRRQAPMPFAPRCLGIRDVTDALMYIWTKRPSSGRWKRGW